MADLKISQLTSATTPLGATDVLPVVQSSTTKKVAASTFAQVGQDNSFTASQTFQKTGASNTQVVLVSELDGSNDYQSALSVRRTGTGGGALWQSKRNTATGGVGWVAKVTVNNAAEVAGTFSDAIEIGNDQNVKISTAAKGVNFTANTPAAGMTSQLLNWYEEGTYTVTLTPDTSGTITLSGSADLFKYTRIGRMVTITGRCTVSSVSSPVGGTIRLSLPIAISSSSESESRIGGAISSYNNVTTVNYAIIGDSGSSSIDIYVNAASIAAGMSFSVSFSYCV